MDPWQDIAALVCVVVAAMYIVWRATRHFLRRAKSSCGGCSSCGAGEAKTDVGPLVTLQAPERRSSLP